MDLAWLRPGLCGYLTSESGGGSLSLSPLCFALKIFFWSGFALQMDHTEAKLYQWVLSIDITLHVCGLELSEPLVTFVQLCLGLLWCCHSLGMYPCSVL